MLQRSFQFSRVAARSLANDASLKRTPLFDFHNELGAKMVPFAGWEMPVQYKEGVLKSHLHTRTDASLFDVSHMGSLHITGKDHIKFLESITVADVQALKKDQARLSSILTDKFTIIDDCMITRRDNHVYMVINAGCFDKDMKHINAKLAEFNAQGGDCKIDVMQDRALLAIQGPKAAAVVQQHLPGVDLAKVNFMSAINATFVGAPDCIVSRCGYTGEDGFEIHVPAAHAARVAHTLLKDSRMLPAGLGARDSLRLEAGLCLYGHDLDETVTPIEATLLWTITKRRREQGGFPGFDVFQKQMKEGVSRKRVGLATAAPAREHTELQTVDGVKVGEVTSGTMSPCLKSSISMAYVQSHHAALGTKLKAIVRGKAVDATVVKMPFVPNQYYKMP